MRACVCHVNITYLSVRISVGLLRSVRVCVLCFYLSMCIDIGYNVQDGKTISNVRALCIPRFASFDLLDNFENEFDFIYSWILVEKNRRKNLIHKSGIIVKWRLETLVQAEMLQSKLFTNFASEQRTV